MSKLLNSDNIDLHCKKLSKSCRHFCSSFLTSILDIVNSVKYLNTNVEDFFVQSPMFDIYHCDNVFVVKLFLTSCSCEFRRKLRYKLGHSFELIFNLDHITLYSDHVTFFSTVCFEKDFVK